jgi:hypothetical protein
LIAAGFQLIWLHLLISGLIRVLSGLRASDHFVAVWQGTCNSNIFLRNALRGQIHHHASAIR